MLVSLQVSSSEEETINTFKESKKAAAYTGLVHMVDKVA